MPITRVNEFQAADNKAEELSRFLQSLIPFIESSKGNISVEILREHENDHQFMVIEKWDSIASHQRSVESFPKDEMQAAMSLFGAPPTGRYFTAVK